MSVQSLPVPFVAYRQGPRGLPGTDGGVGPQGPPGTIPVSVGNLLDASGTVVKTWAEFAAAVANGDTRIVFGDDITQEASITIPHACTVTVVPYNLIQGGAHTILWYGYMPHHRTQLFQGYLKSQIRGPFGTGYVCPEWWGLLGTTQSDGECDIAINKAIGANIDGLHSVNVSLTSFAYYTKRPIDLRGSKSRLVGVSPAATGIHASTNWSPDTWEYSSVFQSSRCNMVTPFTAVASAGVGKIRVTTSAGGTTELFAGQSVTLSGSAVPSYNATLVVDNVVDHQTVDLLVAFAGTAAGTLTPITLDSVMATGANSHSAMILMGSDTAVGGKSFFSAVEKLAVNGYHAVVNNPLKRISLISWSGYVEENSYIHDVNVSGFSGFGIGGESVLGVTTVNGMTISKFHVAAGMRRAAIGLYIPKHGGCVDIRVGTLDLRVLQQYSRASVDPVPNGYTWEWPQFGCLLAGTHTGLSQVHVEGVGNAFHILATGGGCGVTISNCDHNHGMDQGMIYFDDSDNRKKSKPNFATQEAQDNLGDRNAYLFHHGAGVTCGGMASDYQAANCYDAVFTVINYHCSGTGRYLLRDWIYNVDFTGFGGRFPAQLGRAVGFYSRGIPYGPGVESNITAAVTHASGTKLTVVSSAGITAGQYISILSDDPDDIDYGPGVDFTYLTGWQVFSVPSATEIVIVKVFTTTLTGSYHRNGAYYNRAAPPVDRQYFIGPLW